jgi:plasmid stabilization system protein ParE
MSLPIVLRREASAEFEEAFDYYESQRAGRGVTFTEQVQEVFERIAATPELHAVVLTDVRRAVVPRFPYIVLYRSDGKRVEVIAVFHTSRDPSVWQARV